MRDAFQIVAAGKDPAGERGRRERLSGIVSWDGVIFVAPQQLGLLASKKLHVQNML